MQMSLKTAQLPIGISLVKEEIGQHRFGIKYCLFRSFSSKICSGLKFTVELQQVNKFLNYLA
jgi:hypothetical protein